MRFSIATQVACGAVAVSAMATPTKRQAGPLSLDDFGHFETISFEEAKAGTAAVENDTTVSVQDIGDEHFGVQAVCANPRVRVEWRNMEHADRISFLDSVKCLMNMAPSGSFSPAGNRYEDLVAVHQLATTNVHMSGLFLPWHRYYLWLFSRLLREECGYTAPLPWWDETRDSGNFVGSGLFTDEYFGALPTGEGCIENGAFGGTTLNIGPGSNNRPHCLQRAVDESQTANVNQGFVDQCNGRPSYQDMEGCMERGPHAFGHNGIGGVMAEVSASPGDPIFFLHHGFVDRTWHQWQLGDPARFTTISGCAAPGENCEQLTPETVLASRGLRPDVIVRDMLDIREEFLCYTYDY